MMFVVQFSTPRLISYKLTRNTTALLSTTAVKYGRFAMIFDTNIVEHIVNSVIFVKEGNTGR